MHAQILKNLQHTHDFSVINRKGEHRIRLVLILTFFTMCIEITAGMLFNSMALLADGWAYGNTRCRLYDYFICLSLFTFTRA